MKFKYINSKNHSTKKRNKKDIKFIVLHYTGMQSEAVSIKRLTSKKHKVSTHYLVSRNGSIIKMVDEKNISWHAGISKWKNIKNLNYNSIGIEIVNKGHQFGYENFPKIQISKLITLCRLLMNKYKIKSSNLLGHSDIAPLRKKDPGEKFPWLILSKKGLGNWHNINKAEAKIEIKQPNILRNKFFNNLHKIGYRYFDKKKSSKFDIKIIKAFQRRYRQNKINGLIDNECIQISSYLAKDLKN